MCGICGYFRGENLDHFIHQNYENEGMEIDQIPKNLKTSIFFKF